jgi:DNA-binding NtrC family response regulator
MVNSILIVDDDEDFRFGLTNLIKQEFPEWSILQGDSCAAAKALIKQKDIQLILLDYQLPDGNSLSVLSEIEEHSESVDVIMITAHGSLDLAVEAMQKGASDFVPKPIDFKDLAIRIRKVLETRKFRQVTEFYQSTFEFQPFIGTGPEIAACRELARSVAVSDKMVLILGETGTGKEVMARHIHSISNRKDKPFVIINCASQSEELIGDEIFGHERGAFTNAYSSKKGKVELADDGTIFLDELGELSLNMQAKILRFIEDKKYARIGGIKERRCSARLIAATNRNLQNMVSQGLFRNDLFFRLNIFPITLPPLRQRKEDIPELVYHFLRNMTLYDFKKEMKISGDALEYLMEYDWPGNIRELRNVIERATVLADDGKITVKHLPVLNSVKMPEVIVEVNQFKESMRRSEKHLVVQALRASNWNQTEAARTLQINRQYLIRLMKKHNISVVRTSSGNEEG